MFGYSPLGSTALGGSASSASTGGSAAALSAAISGSSAITAAIKTGVLFSAPLSSASSLSASFSATKAMLQATLTASSTSFASLTAMTATPTYTPSAARTIDIQPIPPLYTGGKFWNLADPKKPRGAKDPNATIDITFNWTAYLADIGNAGIDSVVFTLDGVTTAASFQDGAKTTVFVTGGKAGSAASVACKITTDSNPSRVDERTIYLDLEEE